MTRVLKRDGEVRGSSGTQAIILLRIEETSSSRFDKDIIKVRKGFEFMIYKSRLDRLAAMLRIDFGKTFP